MMILKRGLGTLINGFENGFKGWLLKTLVIKGKGFQTGFHSHTLKHALTSID